MTTKASIVHNIAGLIPYQRAFSGVARFIYNKPGEERLTRHINTFPSPKGRGQGEG
jgi:hypothetical protein